MPQSIAQHIPKPPNFHGLRLGAKTVEALELMARAGVSLAEAADATGIRKSNLQRSFDMPAVRDRYNALQRYVVDNEGLASFLRISELAKSADSEHVRLEANKWLAGVDGLAPVKRVESKVAHSVQFGGFDYGKIGKDVSPKESSEDETV